MLQTRLDTALQRFSHPLTLAAAATLLANATIFQRQWPGWWTGKLGDLAWLTLAPLMLAAMLALLPRLSARDAGRLALAIITVGFVSAKTLAPVNAALRALFEAGTGMPAKLALDPSDLLALPGLAVAYWVWNRNIAPMRRPALQAAAWCFAALAIMADSPAPQEFGIVCVVRQPNSLAAVSQTSQHGYFGDTLTERVFTSADEGRTWVVAPAPSKDAPAPCQRPEHESNWSFTQNTPELHFLFLSNQGVYRTDDGGKTYTQEYATTAPINDAIEAGDGGLIVAAGPQGVLLRSPDGQWTQVEVAVP